MSDLMQCLYDFVCDRRMGSVYNDPEYAEASHGVELQLKKVQLGLDKEQQEELHLLMESVHTQNAIESEHLFQAALSLARELRRAVT